MKINLSNTTQLRVRYSETDQMGYCYYGNYAQYFEVGRVEAIRDAGISYKEIEKQGYMLPVSDFNVKYYKPARYDDVLTIVTNIKELKGPRLFFDYEIRNDQNEIIAHATTTLVFVIKNTMRPVPPPDFFVQLIEKFAI